MNLEAAHARRDQGVICITQKGQYFIKYNPQEDLNEYHEAKYAFDMSYIQKSLYLRLILGTKYYTQDQLDGFTKESIDLIVNNHLRAKRVIFNLKLRVFFKPFDDLMSAIFPKKFNRFISKKEAYYLMQDVNFVKLGITDRVICEELVKHGLLPDDFFYLTE